MARRPPGPCPEPGCPNLTPCADHNLVRIRTGEAKRPSARAQGYDRAWERLRIWHLHRYPLCVRCGSPGTTRSPNHVDHIVELEDGGARLDPANLQTLCLPCHNRKTAEAARVRRHGGGAVGNFPGGREERRR